MINKSMIIEELNKELKKIYRKRRGEHYFETSNRVYVIINNIVQMQIYFNDGELTFEVLPYTKNEQSRNIYAVLEKVAEKFPLSIDELISSIISDDCGPDKYVTVVDGEVEYHETIDKAREWINESTQNITDNEEAEIGNSYGIYKLVEKSTCIIDEEATDDYYKDTGEEAVYIKWENETVESE